MFKCFYILVFSTILYASCESNPPVPIDNTVNWTSENSSDLNQGWVKDEQFLIDEFVDRHHWEMTTSASGLRYMIYEFGNEINLLAKPGQLACVEYEVAPLGDTVVYRSNPGKPDCFKIEMDYVEYGIHEAITYMRVGDKAKIILPNHLAHGLLGDDLKIPPLSAVVYDLKIIELE